MTSSAPILYPPPFPSTIGSCSGRTTSVRRGENLVIRIIDRYWFRTYANGRLYLGLDVVREDRSLDVGEGVAPFHFLYLVLESCRCCNSVGGCTCSCYRGRWWCGRWSTAEQLCHVEHGWGRGSALLDHSNALAKAGLSIVRMSIRTAAWRQRDGHQHRGNFPSMNIYIPRVCDCIWWIYHDEGPNYQYVQ